SLGQRLNARTDMDGHAAHLAIVAQFDVAEMNAGANRELQTRQRNVQCLRTFNRTVGTFEDSKDAIAGGIHQATSEKPELLTQDLFVSIEQRPPRRVTEFGSMPG